MTLTTQRFIRFTRNCRGTCRWIYSCNVIVIIVSLLFHYCFIIVSDISIVMKFFIDGLQCCDSRGGQR